ncbi:hypothetical protein ACBR40_27280 [Nonomuraea sp. AD125B]|uniref:hypothetical protein n=1 Tax=Nonomuraea sp. AD125B TaxID=3242897 RepID=UPI0035274D4C
MNEPHPADQPRLIATVAELIAMAADIEPDAPVFVDVDGELAKLDVDGYRPLRPAAAHVNAFGPADVC